MAGAVQETCLSEMLGGPGADFLGGVTFWSIRSFRFAEVILRNSCTKHLGVTQCRAAFGSCHVKKMHAVVARSTCPSQNVQSTSVSDRFWKLTCRKSVRCCGAKHISMSKCTKHLSVGPSLEVDMSKKRTLLWREAHFE